MHNVQFKSEAEQQEFFDQSYACYIAATEAAGIEKHFFDIAGTTVCMSCQVTISYRSSCTHLNTCVLMK
jgi:hypothetical protein